MYEIEFTPVKDEDVANPLYSELGAILRGETWFHNEVALTSLRKNVCPDNVCYSAWHIQPSDDPSLRKKEARQFEKFHKRLKKIGAPATHMYYVGLIQGDIRAEGPHKTDHFLVSPDATFRVESDKEHVLCAKKIGNLVQLPEFGIGSADPKG